MSAATPLIAEPGGSGTAVAAKPGRRFYELDSLRGLAAATVVLYHFNYLLPERWHVWLERGPLRLLVSGHQAVMLFFVLSGFVLTLPYLRRSGLVYGEFLLKRFCRIYLPYLAALGLALAADVASPRLNHVLTEMPRSNVWIAQTWSEPIRAGLLLQHVLFLGVYDNAQYNTAFWSLVYEMRISLVFPFIALAVLRWRGRWVALGSLGLWVLSMGFNRVMPHVLHAGASAVADVGDTVFYAAMFVGGALLAKCLVSADRWYAGLKGWQVGALGVVSVFLYAYAAPTHAIRHLPPGLFDVLSALGTLGLIMVAINCGPVQRMLTSRPVHHLGKVSYSLYLVHGTVLFVLIHTLLGRASLWVVFGVYLVATLAVTEVFHRLAEEPTMLLGRRLTAQRRPRPRTE